MKKFFIIIITTILVMITSINCLAKAEYTNNTIEEVITNEEQSNSNEKINNSIEQSSNIITKEEITPSCKAIKQEKSKIRIENIHKSFSTKADISIEETTIEETTIEEIEPTLEEIKPTIEEIIPSLEEISSEVIIETTQEKITNISIEASIKNKTYYIGDTLSANDFTIIINKSNNTQLINPPGWIAYPLTLTTNNNSITICYENISTTVNIQAINRPILSELEIVQADQFPLGTFGRLYIPSLGINVGLGTTKSSRLSLQQLVDNEDSAALFKLKQGFVIGDHQGQGFAPIKYSIPNQTKAYIKTRNHIYELTHIQTDTGYNNGKGLYLDDGTLYQDIYLTSPDKFLFYTCQIPNEGYYIWLTLWQVNGEIFDINNY